ncbi:MAG: ACP S-malonyltransferase [Legionella sp.]|uniref:ACP S-malonyltransferase n=1 Tax=Legionella sp. TaxID=459 RepID=UPI0039E621F0
MVKTALVFPGQGSQSVGMLADFELQYPIVVDVFAEASESVGYDLWQLVQQGPIERLNQTEYTQVVMLTADVAVFRLLQEQEMIKPSLMAGHSLGEYPALVCAGALSLADAVHLVVHRGQVMQKAVPLGVGAMAAVIGLDEVQIAQLCKEASNAREIVTPANYNSIEQTVVAGHTPAVNRLISLAEEAGARLAKVIPVSVPCHCPLLTEAADVFSEYLSITEFKKPTIDVISNVDVSIYQSATEIREKLKVQLYSPVRWVETIQLFKNSGVELVLECGPGKVLSGLIKRIDRSLNSISVYDTISLEQVLEQLDALNN